MQDNVIQQSRRPSVHHQTNIRLTFRRIVNMTNTLLYTPSNTYRTQWHCRTCTTDPSLRTICNHSCNRTSIHDSHLLLVSRCTLLRALDTPLLVRLTSRMGNMEFPTIPRMNGAFQRKTVQLPTLSPRPRSEGRLASCCVKFVKLSSTSRCRRIHAYLQMSTTFMKNWCLNFNVRTFCGRLYGA